MSKHCPHFLDKKDNAFRLIILILVASVKCRKLNICLHLNDEILNRHYFAGFHHFSRVWVIELVPVKRSNSFYHFYSCYYIFDTVQ